MTLTLKIPDEVAHDLGVVFENLGLAVLEALAAAAYEKDLLSLEQVRRMLELESTWEAQEVLSRHGAWPSQIASEILDDADTSARFRAALP